VLETCRGLK